MVPDLKTATPMINRREFTAKIIVKCILESYVAYLTKLDISLFFT